MSREIGIDFSFQCLGSASRVYLITIIQEAVNFVQLSWILQPSWTCRSRRVSALLWFVNVLGFSANKSTSFADRKTSITPFLSCRLFSSYGRGLNTQDSTQWSRATLFLILDGKHSDFMTEHKVRTELPVGSLCQEEEFLSDFQSVEFS